VHAVGRDCELTAVDRALDAVRSGPVLISICGEPGIGKTTVWRHAAARALARGYRVLSCRPAEAETWLSFAGLADLMDPVPEQELSMLPGIQREALEIALLQRVAPRSCDGKRAICTAATGVIRGIAQAQPVVVAVDDVQWLDTATAEVLEFAGRRLGSEQVIVLASTRADWGAEQPLGLDQVLGDDRVFRLQLGPLSLEAVHQLVRARTGMALSRPELLRLYEASGGNPFFALEIVRGLVRSGARIVPGEPLPVSDGIAGPVAERVSALPEEAREALLFTSALPHATVDLVRAAVNWGGTRLLESAEENGIIEIRDGHIRFSHPIFSSAIYSTAPAAERRWVHRRLAEVADGVEEKAWHMALAVPGPDPVVAAALEKAARSAQTRGAAGTAARLWELAGRRTPPADSGGGRLRMVAASSCLFTAGDARRARPMLEAAMSGMTAGRERARALLWLGTMAYHENRPAEATSLCRRALAETEGDRLLQAALHLRASWFAEHDTAGRVRDAEAAVQLMDDGQISTHPEMLACALLARGYYRFLAGHGIGWGDLRRARALLPPDGRSWEFAWARWIMAAWATPLDQAEARDSYADTYRRVTELGDELLVPHPLVYLAEIECWLGDWREAKAHAAEAIAAAEQTGQRRGRGAALYVEALVDAHINEIGSAREAAERGLGLATADDDHRVAALHLAVLGFAALSLREPVAADRYLSRADQMVTSMGLVEPAGYRFHADHVEVVIARGDLARAAVLEQRLEERARAAPYPWLRIVTARSRAILRAAEGDLDAAIAAVAEALGWCENACLPFEHGRSLLAAGQIRRRRREKLLASEALLTAREIFDALGARLWSSRATEELRRLGLRRGSRHDLTPTEERVAHMVANGLTNREVASALFISHKTVEANLSRIFRKLGIRSRRDLSTSQFLGSTSGDLRINAGR